MDKKNFKIKLKVWKWAMNANTRASDGAWYFVTLPKDMSMKIREKTGKGMKRIEGKIGKTAFHTSLLWHNVSNAYLVAIKKSVRKSEDIFEGDTIDFSFKIM